MLMTARRRILCSNRDEYLSRPTAPAHWHAFGPSGEEPGDGSVLSGRDLRAGGTWLGITRAGRVAFLCATPLSHARRPADGRVQDEHHRGAPRILVEPR